MMRLVFIFISLFLVTQIHAQNDRKLVRKGNKEYSGKKYNEAEVDFRKALENQGAYTPAATYNLGNALYRQNKYDEAANAFSHVADAKIDKKDIAKAYHNLGNTYLQMQKFQESVDAYKKALRNNPNDIESKYNLALAQKLMKNPPKDKNQQNQQNQQNQNNQDKNNQQNQPQNNNQDQNNQDQQQPQPQQGQMSKEQAQQLLRAIQDDENNTQDKVKKEKAKGPKTNPDKDW